jgi:two-component system, sensor histidine kinase PdtaS
LITITVRPDAASRLTLTVDDDGDGLPAGFDIGTVGSLGLTIVKVLVKQLGGVLEVKGGKGTSVRVSFTDKT